MLFLVYALTAASLAQQPVLECGTPAALRVLAGGDVPLADPRVLHAPEGVGVAPWVAPPGGGKGHYGTPYESHHDSANFTVNWWSGEVSRSAAVRTAEILENAWAELVVSRAWTQPVSSDAFLRWVFLDPTMSGTGLTTEYFTDEYPQGYPVVYVNPAYDWDEAFYSNLVAHEFSHALQYAVRDYSAEGWEAWYWEASAQWAPELAAPEVDGHVSSSSYYSERPWYRFDAMSDSHQYGMFVLNAWLEEHQTGPGGMKAVWQLSASRAGVPWDDILVESTGVDAADLWGGFTGAMGNQGLAESHLYTDVLVDGPVSDGFSGAVAYLGTDYFRAAADHTLTVGSPDGHPVLVAGPAEHGAEIQIREGEIIAVTGLREEGPATYLLTLTEPDLPDTGGVDTGDGPHETGGGEQPAVACGCGSAGGGLGLTLLLPVLVSLRRRRVSGP